MTPNRRGASRARSAVLAALLALGAAGASGAISPDRADGAVREYWIKAVNMRWDAAPNGMDVLAGTPIPLADRTMTAIVYRAYTRGWRRPLPGTPRSGDDDGIPGPTLQARVGDRVLVHFKNEDHAYGLRHSMQFHGVSFAMRSAGAYIPRISGRGDDVPVGGTFTYRLTAGPRSAGVWPYHDYASSMAQSIPRGLYGAIAVLRRKERPPDRRFIVYFGETLGFNTIDGRAFLGNTPTFHARVGQRVEWDVLAMGDNFHTFHVIGHRWLDEAGRSTDTQTVGPGESFQMRWREDAPGTWDYVCHVGAHMMNGMIGLYRVER